MKTRRVAGPRRDALRTLLIDDLDAVGADVADTMERAAWLKAAGARVTWLAVAPQASDPDPDAGETLVAHERRTDAIRVLVSGSRWDRVLLGSASAGGGPLARLLPRDARWWPTGIESGTGQAPAITRVFRKMLGADSTLPPIDLAASDDPALPLAWSALEHRPARRSGLPLWDGDFVLAPEGLGGAGGHRILAVFASIADEWSGFDLVAWSHPSAQVEGRARAHGVEMRVHQVGAPPRPAEWAWWTQAAGAVLTGATRLSASMLLRALEAGCPLLWVAPQGPAAALARWMKDRGVAQWTSDDPGAIASALVGMLERGEEVEAAVVAGRDFATRHDPASLTARLAATLGVDSATPRAAA